MLQYKQSPESLLDEYCGVPALAVPLLLLVRPVAVLDDGGGLATLPEALLSVVTTELTLDQHGGLGHLLVIHVLKQQDHAC